MSFQPNFQKNQNFDSVSLKNPFSFSNRPDMYTGSQYDFDQNPGGIDMSQESQISTFQFIKQNLSILLYVPPHQCSMMILND